MAINSTEFLVPLIATPGANTVNSGSIVDGTILPADLAPFPATTILGNTSGSSQTPGFITLGSGLTFIGSQLVNTITNTGVLPEGTNLYYTDTRVANSPAVTALQSASHAAVTLGTANGLSLTGQQLSLGLATSSVAGAMSSVDKVKLNSIGSGANVSSVNGQNGTVVLTTSNINEGTNLYYTDTRVANSPAITALQSASHAAVTLGTSNGLSLTGQQLSLALATTTTAGALSAADKTSLNNAVANSHAPATIGTANGLSLTGQQLSLALATTTTPGAMSAADKLNSHAAVTLGTANGLSLTGQQLSLATATTTTAGALSAADKTALNNASSLAHAPTTIGTANGLSLSGQQLSLALASTTVAGAMSSADKSKLDGVEAGAEVNQVSSVNGQTGNVVLTTTGVAEGTNLYFTNTRVSSNSDVAANTAARHAAVTLGTANGLSLSGQQLSLATATPTTAGALSAADKVKLDGIATGGAQWSTSGNTLSGTEFIGSTNNFPLNIRTNNIESLSINGGNYELATNPAHSEAFLFINSAPASTSGKRMRLRAQNCGAGANLNGGNLVLQSGNSTGTGSSSIVFTAAAPGASGSTVNAASNILSISNSSTEGAIVACENNTGLVLQAAGTSPINIRTQGSGALDLNAEGGGSLNIGAGSTHTGVINIGRSQNTPATQTTTNFLGVVKREYCRAVFSVNGSQSRTAAQYLPISYNTTPAYSRFNGDNNITMSSATTFSITRPGLYSIIIRQSMSATTANTRGAIYLTIVSGTVSPSYNLWLPITFSSANIVRHFYWSEYLSVLTAPMTFNVHTQVVSASTILPDSGTYNTSAIGRVEIQELG